MPIDVLASVLIGILGIVSAVMFVRGVLGMIAHRDHPSHWYI